MAETPQQKPEAPKAEIATNCPVCNKPLKRKKRYYRNQKYYCTKRCWKKSTQKKEEAPA